MTVNPNAPVRSGNFRVDDLTGDDAVNQKLPGNRITDALVNGLSPAGSVTGARGGLQAPPMPGGATPDDMGQGLGLENLGLGQNAATSNDPDAVSARSAVRKALGMSESTPLNRKTIGDAMQQQTPQVLSALKELGLDPGTSMNDPKTVDAIKQLQEAMGVAQTGKLDLEQLLSLVEAAQNKRNAAQAASRASSSGSRGSQGSQGSSSGSSGGSQGLGEAMSQHQPPAQPQRSTWQKAQDFAHDKLGVGPGSAPTGTLRANQKEAYKAAIGEGLSPTAAKALVANMTGESLSKPNDNHWDVSHMSQGIVQWDPSRAAAIKAHFGKEPKDMSVGEQTKAAIWEMKNKYPKTYQALQGSDPQAMVSSLVRDYERPANPSGEIAKRMQHYNNLGDVAG